VNGPRLPLVSHAQDGYQKSFSLRSLSMLAISILGLFLVFMAVMNIIDFGRVD
jgi:hypothetical protein